MYILDRHGNQNAMLGAFDIFDRSPRQTVQPASVPNATFVNTTSSASSTGTSPTGSFSTAAVVVGVLAIGGYFLYKKMRK